MEKENSEKLKKLIQGMVQEELKKSSKEIAKIIKEQVKLQVKQQVNEILAEQFVKTISNNSINNVFSEQVKQEMQTINSVKPVDKQKQNTERSRLKESFNSKLRNMGVLGTESQSIFEDLDLSQPISANGAQGGLGNPLEMDDDGIDLSRFGL